nr:YDG domain-containing protein [uncultured Acetobacterium sp.]
MRASKTYDGYTTAAITGHVGGILSNETPVNVVPVANFNDAIVGDNKTITASFNKTGGGNENYTVPAAYVYSTTGEIT